MRFINEGEIMANATDETFRKLRRDAMEILKAAVEAVEPGDAIRKSLNVEGGRLQCGDVVLDLGSFSRVFVVGGGKASGAMARAIEELLGNRISKGVVNVLNGTKGLYDLQKIELNGASHPVPDEESVFGVGRMLSILDGSGEGDLIVVLISGGGSSLMTYPAEGVGLSDVQETTDLLLRSGATINELNAVRKHLSAVKGGQMARRAQPATVLSLILSDVVGDPLDTIASGPTAPDGTTFKDAKDVLKRYGLWEKAPITVRNRLDRGANSELEETPKPGDGAFESVYNIVVGSNLTAAEAAVGKASTLGYRSMLLSTMVEGEASQVGAALAGVAKEVVATGNPIKPPAAIIVGGETTVTVVGPGRGGRNQELALGAAMKIEGLDAVIAALATDGIDGPTEAAGAIADGTTIARARAVGLDAARSLSENDSYGFFSALGDALLTGQTGTNVNDLALILVDSH